MQKRVLILSYGDDFHALAIQTLLKKHNAEADIVDTETFPTTLDLVQQFSSERSGAQQIVLQGRPLSDYHAIWYRRARAPKPTAEIEDRQEYNFAAQECSQALWGAFYAAGIPIYNQPDAEKHANHKAYQLKIAQKIGLQIPDTFITNSPEAARAYAADHPDLIYKSFSPTKWMLNDTRPLQIEDQADLWRVRYAPIILQEYLPLGREYRVSVIEDDCFVGEIRIDNPKAHFDWRVDENYQVIPAELPADITAKLLALRRALKLNSGAIDLRETPDGRLYFLEINPSGQFLFLDIFGKIDVANRFCAMLLQ